MTKEEIFKKHFLSLKGYDERNWDKFQEFALLQATLNAMEEYAQQQLAPSSGKYSWQKIEDSKYYVWHTEGDFKTLIAITASAEKAHFLATAANQYRDPAQRAAQTGNVDEAARQYAESIMGEGWDRNNGNMVGVFYGYFIEYLKSNWQTDVATDDDWKQKIKDYCGDNEYVPVEEILKIINNE